MLCTSLEYKQGVHISRYVLNSFSLRFNSMTIYLNKKELLEWPRLKHTRFKSSPVVWQSSWPLACWMWLQNTPKRETEYTLYLVLNLRSFQACRVLVKVYFNYFLLPFKVCRNRTMLVIKLAMYREKLTWPFSSITICWHRGVSAVLTGPSTEPHVITTLASALSAPSCRSTVAPAPSSWWSCTCALASAPSS